MARSLPQPVALRALVERFGGVVQPEGADPADLPPGASVEAHPGDLSFLAAPRHSSSAADTRASAVIVSRRTLPGGGARRGPAGRRRPARALRAHRALVRARDRGRRPEPRDRPERLGIATCQDRRRRSHRRARGDRGPGRRRGRLLDRGRHDPRRAGCASAPRASCIANVSIYRDCTLGRALHHSLRHRDRFRRVRFRARAGALVEDRATRRGDRSATTSRSVRTARSTAVRSTTR